MKVEIRIDKSASEPSAIITAPALTGEVARAAAALETAQSELLAVTENGRTTVLRAEDIYLVRVDGERAVVCCKSKQYQSGKRLCDIEAALGAEFLRISKSALVNARQLDCVESLFNGMMLLTLKNGEREYVSRRYLPELKKYLGI